jgi:hypothetical protein
MKHWKFVCLVTRPLRVVSRLKQQPNFDQTLRAVVGQVWPF